MYVNICDRNIQKPSLRYISVSKKVFLRASFRTLKFSIIVLIMVLSASAKVYSLAQIFTQIYNIIMLTSYYINKASVKSIKSMIYFVYVMGRRIGKC